MMKRPLFLAAAVLAAVFAFLCSFFPDLIFPVYDFPDGESVTITGTVHWIEQKSDSVYLYLTGAAAVRHDKSVFSAGTASGTGRTVTVEGAVSGGSQPASMTAGEGNCASPVSLRKVILVMNEADCRKTDVRIGNRISAKCLCRSFHPARNYGNYDEKAYYHSLGIFLKAECISLTLTDRSVNDFRQFLYRLRSRMILALRDVVADDETAGLFVAVCTGERSGLTDETKQLYQQSGIVHILAVSGLHISLIGMTLFRLMRKKLKFIAAATLCSFIMLSFCVLSGGSPSAVRATIMFLVQIAGIGLGKQYDILCSVSLAAILMLLANPCLIMNSAFQMSFTAVLATGLIYRPLEKYLQQPAGREDEKKNGKHSIRRWIRNRVGSGFLMSLSITIALLPLVASIYSEIPVYSLFLNLLVIPLMSVILGTGFLSGLTGMVFLLAGRFFIGSGYVLLHLISWLAGLSMMLPVSSLVVGHPEPWRIGLYYCLLFGCIVLVQMSHSVSGTSGADTNCFPGAACPGANTGFSGKTGKNLRLFMQKYGISCRRKGAVFITVLVLFMVLAAGSGSGGLRIAMLDVDQGECILIESPSGHTFLIDGGSSSQEKVFRYRISSAVLYEGIRTIDYVIITHPDTDHISGIMEMLETAPDQIGNILIPYVPDSEHYADLVSLAEANDIEVKNLHRGMCIQDGNLQFTCLYPPEAYRSDDINSYSAVLDLRYGEFSALFTGDLGSDGEEYLLQTGLEEDFDLLKIAHHGSRFSSTEAFLNIVSPRVALISAGANNRYGHPHAETLDRLIRTGAVVYCTAASGEIVLEADMQGRMKIRTKI